MDTNLNSTTTAPRRATDTAPDCSKSPVASTRSGASALLALWPYLLYGALRPHLPH